MTLNAVNSQGSSSKLAAHKFYQSLVNDGLVSNLLESLQRNLEWEKDFKKIISEDGRDKLQQVIECEQIRLLTLLF